MRRCAVLLILLAALPGCGKPEVTAGGKPVSHWLEAVKSPDAETRKKAIGKLANIGTADSDVLPALMDAVRDEEADVRAEAVLALLRLGPAAKDAIPVLRDAQENDADETVRSHAAKALARIQSGE